MNQTIPLARVGRALPFERIAARSPTNIALICDHASNRVPTELGPLGVAPADLRRHVAWDIGCADLTRYLAARLGAGALLARVSRLVADFNRQPSHPSFVLAESDGVEVPGNRGLTPEAIAARARRYFEPYHEALDAMLRALEAAGMSAALVSIHSFTPRLRDNARWHLGVLSDRDRRLADPLLDDLAGLPGLVVGDNEPYSGAHPEGYSCQHHGDRAGRLNVLIEVRQDLIDTPEGVARIGDLLAPRIARAVASVREDEPAAEMAARR